MSTTSEGVVPTRVGVGAGDTVTTVGLLLVGVESTGDKVASLGAVDDDDNRRSSNVEELLGHAADVVDAALPHTLFRLDPVVVNGEVLIMAGRIRRLPFLVGVLLPRGGKAVTSVDGLGEGALVVALLAKGGKACVSVVTTSSGVIRLAPRLTGLIVAVLLAAGVLCSSMRGNESRIACRM